MSSKSIQSNDENEHTNISMNVFRYSYEIVIPFSRKAHAHTVTVLYTLCIRVYCLLRLLHIHTHNGRICKATVDNFNRVDCLLFFYVFFYNTRKKDSTILLFTLVHLVIKLKDGAMYSYSEKQRVRVNAKEEKKKTIGIM